MQEGSEHPVSARVRPVSTERGVQLCTIHVMIRFKCPVRAVVEVVTPIRRWTSELALS